jgi:hypothetical protein
MRSTDSRNHVIALAPRFCASFTPFLAFLTRWGSLRGTSARAFRLVWGLRVRHGLPLFWGSKSRAGCW